MEDNKTTVPDALGQVSRNVLLLRSIFGGFLMGLANLVPGISGGTMLLASGIYPAFIDALADLTRFRFRVRSMIVIGAVVASAGIGILLLAGTLKELVVHQRWVMSQHFHRVDARAESQSFGNWHAQSLQRSLVRCCFLFSRWSSWQFCSQMALSAKAVLMP